jgi:Carboxypeptidase regulatory-like domain
LRPSAIEFKRDILQMNRPRKVPFVCMGLLLLSPAVGFEATAEGAPASSCTPAQDSASKTGSPGKQRYSHADDFLIRGTVFNENALAFPAVELRFRKEGQKKYKWETYTNSRGEFALRVPQGSNYEILVHAKGFADQTRTVEAKGGGNEEIVVFRMQPVKGDKQ